jgi:hypothetical protein
MGGRNRRRGALLQAVAVASSVLAVLTFLVVVSPPAQADGSWSNQNGTSTTADGIASTDQGGNALVFAVDTDHAVSACSSTDGSCSAGQPDGADSFEIFASTATPEVDFSVTTSAPIGCSLSLAFKVSFNGSPPYTQQNPLTSDNTCPSSSATPTGTPSPGPTHSPPPGGGDSTTPSASPTASGPPPTPVGTSQCPMQVNGGWFEPEQAVWQDDGPAPKFADRPRKQLLREDPMHYRAQLSMVAGKPTRLFGIDHAVPKPIPNDRYDIVLFGTVSGTLEVPVGLRFTLRQADHGAIHEDTVYESPTLRTLKLDGECGVPVPFTVTLPVPDGAPSKGAFSMGRGGYALREWLVREDSRSTVGDPVTVTGDAYLTRGPLLAFLPASLSSGSVDLKSQLKKVSDFLAYRSHNFIPDFYPLRPRDLPVEEEAWEDLSKVAAKAVDSWAVWAQSQLPGGDIWVRKARRDGLVAELTRRLGTAAFLGKVARVVVVLSGDDMDLISQEAAGLSASQKVIFVLGTSDYDTVAHELAHTTGGSSGTDGFLWSSNEMIRDCGVDYHNKKENWAHGYQITLGGVVEGIHQDSTRSIMAPGATRWIDQCTYRHLLDALSGNPLDPRVLLVQGRLGRRGSHTAGQLFPSYELSGAPGLHRGKGGRFAIVLRTRRGHLLARYPFIPGWQGDNGPARSLTSFQWLVPFSRKVGRIDLVGPHGVLDRRTFSRHAPAVQIFSPARGTTVHAKGNAVSVRWHGRDRDGGPLLYTVLSSSDGGKHWMPLVTETSATSWRVPVTPGAPNAVQVVATDGTRSARAVRVFDVTG